MKHARVLLPAMMGLLLVACGLLESTEQKLQNAEAAVIDGRYGEGIVALRNLQEKSPESADVTLALARALFLQGDRSGAERTLQAAIEKGADPAQVAELRLQWLLSEGNFQAVLDAVQAGQSALDVARQQYYRARALQGMRQMPEALRIFSELAVQQPDSPDLQLRIAQCHVYHGREAMAEAAVEKALSLPVPSRAFHVAADAWLVKADLAQRAGDSAGAAEALGKAAESPPGEFGAMRRGQLLVTAIEQSLNMGDLAKAREYQSMLAQMMPQSPIALMAAAQVRLFDQDLAPPIADLQKLLQQAPDNKPARALLAAAQLRAGSLEQALKEVNTLVAGEPEASQMKRIPQIIRAAADQTAGSSQRALAVATALNALQQPAVARAELEAVLRDSTADASKVEPALVQLDLRLGRIADALVRAKRLAADQPQLAAAQAQHAETLVASGDLAAAAGIYESLWRSSPSGQLAITITEVRRRAGKTDADHYLQQWLDQHPDDLAVRLSLATGQQQAGDVPGATRQFQQIASAAPAASPLRLIALNNLAILYSKAGDGRAMDAARAAYQAGKAVPAVKDTYGWVLVQAGRAKEALPILSEAAEAMPANPEVRYHLAVAMAESGDASGARQLLQDILLDDDKFNGRSGAEALLATLN